MSALALFGIEPATAGTIELERQGGQLSARRARRWISASPMSPRTAASSACRLPMSISANITLPMPEALSQPLRPCPDRDGAGHRRDLSQAPGDPHAVGRPSRRQALRRQPAESDAEQMAEHPAVAADPRRADPRHRRRRQGRGPRHDRRARGRGHRHHPDLVRPSRSSGHERPRAGHARGPPDGDLRPRGRDPGDGDDGGHGAEPDPHDRVAA